MTVKEEVECAVYAAMKNEFEELGLGACYEDKQVEKIVSHLERQAIDDIVERLQSLQQTVRFIVANIVEE